LTSALFGSLQLKTTPFTIAIVCWRPENPPEVANAPCIISRVPAIAAHAREERERHQSMRQINPKDYTFRWTRRGGGCLTDSIVADDWAAAARRSSSKRAIGEAACSSLRGRHGERSLPGGRSQSCNVRFL
jgi:hypothetical protein